MKFYTIEGNHKSIFKTFAIYYICMVAFCVVRILASIGVFPQNTFGEITTSLIIQIGILFLLPLILYSYMLKEKPKDVFEICNFNSCNFKVILISFGLGIICFLINIAVSSLFNGILVFAGYEFPVGSGSADPSTITIWDFFKDVILVAVFPAFCEEFLHRGIVLQGTKHMGFKKAIVISSLLFALLHLNIQQVSYAFVVGLILGFVAVITKNIFPAIIIHFTNNLISTYVDYAQIKNWFMGDMLTGLQTWLINTSPILIFFASLFAIACIIGLLCLFIWLLYKQSIVLKVNKAVDEAYNSHNFMSKENGPILLNRDEIFKDVIENCTLLNLEHKKTDSPIDMVMPKEKSRYKMIKRDKIFMWCAIILGALITFFTYVWGLF